MNLLISNKSDKPIYQQINNQIKNLIMTGQLKKGEALPSMRLLAKELRISVITTKRAYEDLEKEGFIESVVGKGSFVSQKNTEFVKEEQLRKLETQMEKMVDIAHSCGVSLQQCMEMISILYKGEST